MTKLDFHGKEDRRWTGPRLRTGAIVGHTTTTSTKIWIRSRYEGKYRLILCKAELTSKELEIGNKTKTPNKYVAGLGDKVVYTELHDFQNQEDRTHVFDNRGSPRLFETRAK